MKDIVIIENDREILEIIEFLLLDKGFKVTAVLNEEDLWRLEKMPDLIILDNWLNGRSGHDICIELKENEETAAIPIILISAANNLREVARSCNADSFIEKPFDIDVLVNEVEIQLAKVDTRV
ncbi:response regulator [Pedobacter sp. MR2016-24]|uniref:response regulator n=1 Tax=Pedobacter sp. MR2016-24 TaxID=2994466 RepID=UPI002247ED81|nr:response regulator [Pedobacter sp. MR2016-24]MCX2486724.1 response regulator [Pedobacter sp. MR2016-24]